MTTVEVLIEVRQERVEECEPTVAAAVQTAGSPHVVLVSQFERGDLAELAASFALDYRVGPAVLADFKRVPTLVLRPGQLVTSAYLHQQEKKGLPHGIFFMADEAMGETALASEPAHKHVLKAEKAGLLTRIFGARTGGAAGRGGAGRVGRGWQSEAVPAEAKRSIERHHVSMKATVNGQLGRCIDIHQRGGGFLLAKCNLSIDDRVPVAVECRNVHGAVETAAGTLHVRSIRTATDAGETWRVSGIVEWKTPRDLAVVLEHAYIVERFAQPEWGRSASRAPVSIPATVQGHSAECIDLSLGGAAFAVDQFEVAPTERLKIVLHLANGQNVVGHLMVRGVSQTKRLTRVSGTMTWDDDTWLIRHTRLQFRPTH